MYRLIIKLGGTLTQNVTGAVSETFSNTHTTATTGAKTESAASMDINGGSEIDMDASTINLN